MSSNGLEGAYIASRVKGEVKATVSDLYKVVDDGLALRKILGVDEFSGSKLWETNTWFNYDYPIVCKPYEPVNHKGFGRTLRATSFFLGLVSMAMILLAFLAWAPWRSESPTQPRYKQISRDTVK